MVSVSVIIRVTKDERIYRTIKSLEDQDCEAIGVAPCSDLSALCLAQRVLGRGDTPLRRGLMLDQPLRWLSRRPRLLRARVSDGDGPAAQ